MSKEYDVIIVGSGPAGLTAALYCGRAHLKTAIIEKDSLGGAIQNVEMIENWPGVEEGSILGSDLASNMLSQMMAYEVDLECPVAVERIEVQDNGLKKIYGDEGEYLAKAVILTGGTYPKKLPIEGVDEFFGNGIYCCVLCDGDPLAGKSIAIIGGGDSGLTAALYMARLGCGITLIEAMDSLNGCQILQGRVRDLDGLDILCSTLATKIESDGDSRVIHLKNRDTGKASSISVDGIFMLAGRVPNTAYLKNAVALNDHGFIKVSAKMETSIPGIFAAGDIRAESAMQIVTAAGDGATAAITAEHYINEINW
ncbi:MAG: FAD-dependent oxidoreductase [Desulfobacteraceae bacterium]|nr:FAD-dependent oxidoreductase [Desulfobacteraceae bacterium]